MTRKWFDEAMPLLKLHYIEVAHYQDIELDPDIDQYERMENAGAIRCFVARDELGLMVGYAVFFIRHNIHYRKSLQAVQDIIFIDPKKRGFGTEFIQWCDEQLKIEGIQAVYQHVKIQHDFGPLLKRLGYEPIDVIWGRRLD